MRIIRRAKIGGAMLTDREIARQFCDSLRKLMQDCGYTGATGTDKDALRQMKAFLRRAFQGLGTDDVITDKTLADGSAERAVRITRKSHGNRCFS